MISRMDGRTARKIGLLCAGWAAILILTACGRPGGGAVPNDNDNDNANGDGGSVPSGAARVYGRVLHSDDDAPRIGVHITPAGGDGFHGAVHDRAAGAGYVRYYCRV